MEVIHARRIPTHGGSIRVYACRSTGPISASVGAILEQEKRELSFEKLLEFKERVAASKLALMAPFEGNQVRGWSRFYGIRAPSRAGTLVNHVGLDSNILDCVLEIKGSYKIGKYMPGTLIPVIEEEKLFADQPEYALLFSWHIAEELDPKTQEQRVPRQVHRAFANAADDPRPQNEAIYVSSRTTTFDDSSAGAERGDEPPSVAARISHCHRMSTRGACHSRYGG